MPLLSLSLPIYEMGECTEDGLAAPAGMQEELVLGVWGGSHWEGESFHTSLFVCKRELNTWPDRVMAWGLRILTQLLPS